MEVEKYFEEGNDKISGANLEILEANCPNCGAGLSQKARFCGQCGSKMKGVFKWFIVEVVERNMKTA